MDSAQTISDKKIFTLGEVTKSIETLFKKSFPGNYWVKAEIAKLNLYPKSGHCYPELVEKKNGKVQSQIRAIMWASDCERINKKFKAVTREDLREGMNVLLLVKIEFHATYGLNLRIIDIDASFSLGEMAEEKRKTIERLKSENIFDANKKIKFPWLPKRLAVLSVQTSKGYNDFISIINGNQWGYTFSHALFPALLQGDNAVASLRSQLQKVKFYVKHFDAVLIIRGGGGDIGLSCYDNYQLARDVALFPLPVISGIGHSTNETVVEMVSCVNKITPTDVAYFLIQHFHEYSARVETAEEIISTAVEILLKDEKKRLHDASVHFKNGTRHLLNQNRFTLKTFAADLQNKTRLLLQAKKNEIKNFSGTLRMKPQQKISGKKLELQNCKRMMDLHVKQLLKNKASSLKNFEEKLILLDPKNVLKRGYSITLHNGNAIKDASLLKKGDEVISEFYNGKITSTIN